MNHVQISFTKFTYIFRLQKPLCNESPKTNFVQTILTDEQELNSLKQSAMEMWDNAVLVLSELVAFTKVRFAYISVEYLTG